VPSVSIHVNYNCILSLLLYRFCLTILYIRDDKVLEVGGQGTAVIRLTFQNKQNYTGSYLVYLFLNDSVGNGEECFQFNINFE
jgi:hypothetical protein